MRCIGVEVISTARTRSSRAVSTLRPIRPRCSSICVGVIRNVVVRNRMMPSAIGMATPKSCHQPWLPLLPSTKMPTSTGRNFTSSTTGCTSSMRGSSRRQGTSGAYPAVPGGGGGCVGG